MLLAMDNPPSKEQREAEAPKPAANAAEEEIQVQITPPKAPVKEKTVIFQPKRKPPPPKPVKPIAGYVEYVDIIGINERAKAKLDTGALTSSVNAEIIKRFKRDEKEFVTFRVVLDEEQEQVLEREVIRNALIKKKEGGNIRRPVVELELCIIGKLIKGEVNLSQRDHFIYPMLIGRNMLEDTFVVDSGKTFTTTKRCDTSKS